METCEGNKVVKIQQKGVISYTKSYGIPFANHDLTRATKLAPFSVNLLNYFQALAKYLICMVIHGWNQWWIQQELKSPKNNL